jgi:diphosphomevalonate decarboxylase
LKSIHTTAKAQANPNIAFVKYWGDCDSDLRLPANGSISMNLGSLFTQAQVTFKQELKQDLLTINGESIFGLALERVNKFLDLVRELAGKQMRAEVISSNNFPVGAGIASSAAAFAALSLAATRAMGLEMSEKDLSRLARRGSGSACRSIPSGFVLWQPGCDDQESYACSIAPPEHWALVDCIAIVKAEPKKIGSSQGHRLAGTSILQASRVADVPRRLKLCSKAIEKRDFALLADIIELDSNLMHAVMMTSSPPLFYWESASIDLMKAIPDWRYQGYPAAYTLDAGPNVHVICEAQAAGEIRARLEQFPGVIRVLTSLPGGSAHYLDVSS